MKNTIKGKIKNISAKPVVVHKGSSILELLAIYKKKIPFQPVAAVLNNQIVDLQTPITSDFEIEFLSVHSRWGASVYRRSLTLILLQAVHETYPKAKVHIGQSLANGYYFDFFLKRKSLTKKICDRIETAMRKIISAKRPFEIIIYDLLELQDLFKEPERQAEDVIKYADIALDLQEYGFAAILYHHIVFYFEPELYKGRNILAHYMYCLEKIGITHIKNSFQQDFDLEFKKIEDERQEQMKRAANYSRITENEKKW